MKNRDLLKLLFPVVLGLLLSGGAAAQQGMIQFDNGITVAIRTETTSSADRNSSFGNIYSYNQTDSVNVVHRVMTDTANKIYFGYDLAVEPLDEGRRFRVAVKPLSKAPGQLTGQNDGTGRNPNYDGFTAKTLPKYPSPLIVEDGDTITLGILENPQTKVRISDLIKIVSKSSNWEYYYTDDRPAKDFSIDEVMLRMEKPAVSWGGKTYEIGASISGNINWIYIQGKGRFIFSFAPQPGYNFQKIGVIRNNRISFELNGDSYEIVSKTPVLGAGGNWNLWVMFDPDFQPNYRLSAESPFMLGAAGTVDNLFEKL